MATVRELLSAGANLPSDSPRLDSEILLCHCLEKPRAWLYTWPEAEVACDVAERFTRLLGQRLAGEPIAYLTGESEFWSLSLLVSTATLIPRPETESLVAWALELDLPLNAMVADLGTGTGAIALALASERPAWYVTAVDVSEEALTVARENARRLELVQVSFLHSDWYEALAGASHHLLVANPPYIDAADSHLAEGDVRFEPRTSLVADDAGLADLARLISDAPSCLYSGGWLLLEHGYQQGSAVRELLGGAGFTDISTRCDLADQERVTGGRWCAD